MKEHDETLITRWFDDELSQAEQLEMESYLEQHPELLDQREEYRSIRAELQSELPAELEVPHADFFASRISHEIDRIEEESTEVQIREKSGLNLRSWWLPLMAAAAALVVGFFGGVQVGNDGPSDLVDGSSAVDDVVESSDYTVLFTPDATVRAELVDSQDATVILLDGIDRLPESLELAGVQGDYFLTRVESPKHWQ